MKIKLLLTVLLLFSSLPAVAKTIKVYTTDSIRNLNPFMCSNQVEFMLQEIVFPPLVDNFLMKQESATGYRELIISPGAFRPQGQPDDLTKKEVSISIERTNITLRSLEENFKAVKILGQANPSHTPFNWNYGTVSKDSEGNIKIEFERGGETRFQGGCIPMVNFDSVRWSRRKWSGNNEYNIPITTNKSTGDLIGYPLYGDKYGYCYKGIRLSNETVTLHSKKENSPEIEVTVIPVYQQLIKKLIPADNSEDEAVVGLNISPLTTGLDWLNFYDQGFAHNYIKMIRFTKNGLNKHTHLRIKHFRYIRHVYAKQYRDDAFFGETHAITRCNGFTRFEPKSPPSLSEVKKREDKVWRSFTLQYIRDDLTDELVNIITNIFREMEFELLLYETERINEDSADMIIETIYLIDPPILNVRYYEAWNKEYFGIRNSSGAVWGGIAERINKCYREKNLKNNEEFMLNSLPVIFLYQYSTRIGYRGIKPKRVRQYMGKETKGSPFFFYNVINWE